MYLEPSAPPLTELLKDEDVHYNCENGCDVEILVGRSDDDLMRIPVHSCKLKAYPVFAAMLSDKYNITEKQCNGYSKLKQIYVRDVDGKVFDNLMKFIYKKPVNLQSPEMAIETLKAAHQFLFPELVSACVKQLHKMISLSNVLYIFASVHYLCNDLKDLENLTRNVCMPLPKWSHNDHLSAGMEVKKLCLWLLCQCLAFIDVHGAKVLESDEMEELHRSYIASLVRRDSLDVSESAVFSALVRWAETDCKRKHLPLTPESKRKVLDDLIYFVRYFQMTLLEFETGPEASGLLKHEEVEMIKNVIMRRHSHRRLSCSSTCCSRVKQNNLSEPNNNSDNLVNQLKSHWNYFSQPRRNSLNEESNKNKRSSGWNTHQFKLRKVGFLIKRICLPCAYGKNMSSQKEQKIKEKELAKVAGARKESTISVAFDFSLRVFAFFFD